MLVCDVCVCMYGCMGVWCVGVTGCVCVTGTCVCIVHCGEE